MRPSEPEILRDQLRRCDRPILIMADLVGAGGLADLGDLARRDPAARRLDQEVAEPPGGADVIGQPHHHVEAAVAVQHPRDHPAVGEATELVDDGEQALAWSQALAPLLGEFGYAALSLAGRERPLLSLQLAAATAPEPALLARLTALAELDGDGALDYADVRRAITKRALVAEGLLEGIAFFGEAAAASWLRDALLAGQPVAPLRRWLFLPAATPPEALVSRRGRTVCNCQDVAETEIASALAAGARSLETLQERLKCGTGCGACVPELNRMIDALTRAA